MAEKPFVSPRRLKHFFTGLLGEKLNTKEEILANTDVKKFAGAMAVQEMFEEVNDSLGGVKFITEDGKGITGYTLNGADTVFPFKQELPTGETYLKHFIYHSTSVLSSWSEINRRYSPPLDFTNIKKVTFSISGSIDASAAILFNCTELNYYKRLNYSGARTMTVDFDELGINDIQYKDKMQLCLYNCAYGGILCESYETK